MGAHPRVCTWTPALLPGAAQLARPRPEWKAKGAQVAAWDEAAECGPQTRQSAAISGWLFAICRICHLRILTHSPMVPQEYD